MGRYRSRYAPDPNLSRRYHMSKTDEQRGKRPGPDSTRGAAHQRLIETGLAQLLDSGVVLGLDHLKLADVIEAADVSRATAYRSLEHDELEPQQVLRYEVVQLLLSRASRNFYLEAVTDAVAEELQRQEAAAVDLSDPDQRASAIQQIIRTAGNASFATFIASTERAIMIAAMGSVRSRAVAERPIEIDQWVHGTLEQSEVDLVELFGSMYLSVAALFGLELKSEFTVGHLAVAGVAAMEGLGMRAGINEHVENFMRPTGPNGELQEWSMFAVMFEGLVQQFFD